MMRALHAFNVQKHKKQKLVSLENRKLVCIPILVLYFLSPSTTVPIPISNIHVSWTSLQSLRLVRCVQYSVIMLYLLIFGSTLTTLQSVWQKGRSTKYKQEEENRKPYTTHPFEKSCFQLNHFRYFFSTSHNKTHCQQDYSTQVNSVITYLLHNNNM